MDESGSESGGVVSPIPATESADASGYESVSTLDPQTFWAVFFGVRFRSPACGCRFWVCVCRLCSGFSFGGVQLVKKKGHRPTPKPAVIRRSLFGRLKSGSFGGHPRGNGSRLGAALHGGWPHLRCPRWCRPQLCRFMDWMYPQHYGWSLFLPFICGGASDSVFDSGMTFLFCNRDRYHGVSGIRQWRCHQFLVIDSVEDTLILATETGTMAFLASGGASDSRHQQCGGHSAVCFHSKIYPGLTLYGKEVSAPFNRKFTSLAYCCEFCVPCVCRQGTTATRQFAWTLFAVCCGVSTPRICSEPPVNTSTRMCWNRQRCRQCQLK